jgi:hypothetical protein
MKEIIRFGKKFDKTYNLFFGIIEWLKKTFIDFLGGHHRIFILL